MKRDEAFETWLAESLSPEADLLRKARNSTHNAKMAYSSAMNAEERARGKAVRQFRALKMLGTGASDGAVEKAAV